MVAATAAGGLSPADIESIRATLDNGRKPKVVFTVSAGQIAGQTGQVVALEDPSNEEWVIVRFGSDELPFSPADLAIAPKAAKRVPKAAAEPEEAAPEETPPSAVFNPSYEDFAAALPPQRKEATMSAPASGGDTVPVQPGPPARKAAGRQPKPKAPPSLTVTFATPTAIGSSVPSKAPSHWPSRMSSRPARRCAWSACSTCRVCTRRWSRSSRPSGPRHNAHAERLRTELAEIEARLADLPKLPLTAERGVDEPDRWRTPPLWRLALAISGAVVGTVCRLRVTGRRARRPAGRTADPRGEPHRRVRPVRADRRLRAARARATDPGHRRSLPGAADRRGDAGVRTSAGRPSSPHRRRRAPGRTDQALDRRRGRAGLPGGSHHAGSGHVAGARQDRPGAAGDHDRRAGGPGRAVGRVIWCCRGARRDGMIRRLGWSLRASPGRCACISARRSPSTTSTQRGTRYARIGTDRDHRRDHRRARARCARMSSGCPRWIDPQRADQQRPARTDIGVSSGWPGGAPRHLSRAADRATRRTDRRTGREAAWRSRASA